MIKILKDNESFLAVSEKPNGYGEVEFVLSIGDDEKSFYVGKEQAVAIIDILKNSFRI